MIGGPRALVILARLVVFFVRLESKATLTETHEDIARQKERLSIIERDRVNIMSELAAQTQAKVRTGTYRSFEITGQSVDRGDDDDDSGTTSDKGQ